jgi:hypothetical protein
MKIFIIQPLIAYGLWSPTPPLVLNMLQFTKKLPRLETMNIPKFVWSVFVAFVAVGLVAPQQAEAVPIKPVHGKTSFSRTANITQTGGVNTLNVDNPLAVDSVTEDFIPFANSDATFADPLAGQGFFQWTGNGSSAALISGSRWNMLTFTTFTLFAIAPIQSLTSLTFRFKKFYVHWQGHCADYPSKQPRGAASIQREVRDSGNWQ